MIATCWYPSPHDKIDSSQTAFSTEDFRQSPHNYSSVIVIKSAFREEGLTQKLAACLQTFSVN